MSEARIETMPAEAFRTAVGRKVADGLAEPKTAPRTARPGLAEDRAPPPDAQVREIVDSALRDVIGSATELLMVRGDPAVGKLIGSVVEQLPDIIASRRQALTERNIEALVEVFLGADPLAAALPAVAQDNAKAQARFLKTWPVLTAEGVAERAAHASANRSATASRWKSARRIFSVRAGGRDAYPAFQFDDDGRPRPVIAAVLANLPDTMSGWQTAFWFVGANGWLGGDAPVGRLHDVEALVRAAEQENYTWVG